MLFGNRRRLDSALPPFPKHPGNSTSREYQFGKPVPMSGVDGFGLLCGNGRRRDTVLPPFSSHSRILGLLPPRTTISPARVPEECDGLGVTSKLTALVSRAKNALSGKAEPQDVPEKVPLAGMPSEKLVVIQIIRSNHQQHGGSEPLLLQGQSENSFSTSKSTGSSRIKELSYDGEKIETKESSTLDEYQVQGLEHTDTREESDEINRSGLDETTGGDTADDGKRNGQEHNTCLALEEDVGIAGQNIGGRINDSEEDGNEWSDSSRLETLPKEGSAACQVDNGHTANEGEGHEKDRGVSSRFGELSNEESVASHIEDGSTAKQSEEDGRERSGLSKSVALAREKHVDLPSEDIGTEDVIERAESDNGDISMSMELYVSNNAVSQPDVGDVSSNRIKGKEKERDREGRPISDSLPSEGALLRKEEVDTAGKHGTVRKEHRDFSDIDAFSELSSDDNSDGGVPLCNFQADESVQAEDVSDEGEENSESNEIFHDDSSSLLSEDRPNCEVEAAVAVGRNSEYTSSDKENSIPSGLSSGSPRLQYASSQLEDAADHNGDAETSHETSISSSESSDDEGPWVMGVDHRGDIQAHHISPLHFNVCELREPETTPSIDSGESELDDTSPLFHKRSATANRPTHAQHAPPSTSGEADGYSSIKASLNVWRDGSGNANSGGKPTLRRKPGMVFKDVSNTHQLRRNAQGTEIYQDPVKENKDLVQTQNNTQRVPGLQTSVPYLQQPLRTPGPELRQCSNEPSEYVWPPSRDPVRAAHFAASLAILEGRVSPTTGTPEPLIRCARQEYGPDVLLDWPQPPLFHPKPIRPWLGEKAVNTLEEQVVSADRMALSAEMISCARQQYGPEVQLDWPTPPLIHPKPIRPWLGEKPVTSLEEQVASAEGTGLSADMKPQTGPSEATPDSVHYPRTGTFYSKRNVENSKNRAANPTWTSFFARAKPQVLRANESVARCREISSDGYGWMLE